ncbi:YcxB family protein [Streptomyces sp. NPDC088350]|uniref:YcxB family protein n=1 Tax=Streptomyces sp. NPDC088350 TaxID=3365854 RepID=UPI00382A4EA9
MQQTLTLRYIPEADDLFDVVASSVAWRRLRNRAVRNAGASLLLLWGCLLWLAAVKPTWQTLLPALFFVTVFAVAFVNYVLKAFVFSFRWGLRRKARAHWRRSPTMRQTHHGEIGPHNLTLRVEGRTSIYDWSHFGGFRESDRQFVLLDRSGKASVAVPKRAFSDMALVPVCRTLLTQYLADSSPTPPAATSADDPPAPTDEPGSQRDQSS